MNNFKKSWCYSDLDYKIAKKIIKVLNYNKKDLNVIDDNEFEFNYTFKDNINRLVNLYYNFSTKLYKLHIKDFIKFEFRNLNELPNILKRLYPDEVH